MKSIFTRIAVGVAAAMVITAVTLPGRSPQEAAVLKGLTALSTGSIKAAEGQG